MRAQITTYKDNIRHTNSGLFDLDDALSSAKQMLKLGKADQVKISTTGSYIYWVTKENESYKIKGRKI